MKLLLSTLFIAVTLFAHAIKPDPTYKNTPDSLGLKYEANKILTEDGLKFKFRTDFNPDFLR